MAASGCATTRSPEVLKFDPIPVAPVAAEDLAPVDLRPVSELLRESQEAFARANEAQEAGDFDAAYQHYVSMMELFMEAGLDPAIFYNLRGEFERILAVSTEQAAIFERHRPRRLPEAGVDRIDIAGGLEIPFPVPERVLIEIDQIQQLYPEGFQRGLDRSAKYQDFIEAELAKAGLPTDLFWLAMVESQFTPKINSRVGAGGMWQFMRSTGERYGLRIDYYVDERYDWQKSTRAAILYLRDLHALFDGNWPLAISAYNMGERGIERLVAANGGDRNLWRLIETPPAANRMPRETKKFYPRLLATLIVSRMPERYGFTVSPEPPDATTTVRVAGAYDLVDLNSASGLPSGTLIRLNPELVRGVTPPNDEYDLKVLAGTDARVLASLKQIPSIRMAASGAHVVRKGETLSGIAHLHGVSVRDLMELNNIRNPKRLRAGQSLIVGGRAQLAAARVGPNGAMVHTIRGGETLSHLSARYNVSVRNIQDWNALGQKTTIRPGDKLVVSRPRVGASAPPASRAITHAVRRGENPGTIAKRYGVPVNDLLAWNDLTRRSVIRVGQKLQVYSTDTTAGLPAPQPPGTTRVLHAVQSGESAGIIAAKYKVATADFLAWNGLGVNSVLFAGKEYVLYVADSPASVGNGLTSAGNGHTSTKLYHTVQSGENPSTIAELYGVKLTDLFEWNEWSDAPVLQVGQKIEVHTP